MGNEAREYLRAAQEAELRGDKAQAISLLRKAALVYKGSGSGARALQMLRHAQRLGDTSEEVVREMKTLEWAPENAIARAIGASDDGHDPSADETQVLLAPLDEIDTEPSRRALIERGPTRADPSLAAWCSFCCKPKDEVGPLVAGPAGAFICERCLVESSQLLGVSSVSPEPKPKPLPVAPMAPVALELIGQAEAVKLLDAALRVGLKWVLLLGPEGSGKTTCLRSLASQGLGVHARSAHEVKSAAPGQRLLLDADDADALAGLVALSADVPVTVVLAMRGALPPAAVQLQQDQGVFPFHSARALTEATQGRLPPRFADRIEVAVGFQALTVAELAEVGRGLLARRAAELDVSDELLQALAAQAHASGRGGREMESLLMRLPAGSWTVAGPPVKKKRSKKKG